MTSYVLVSRLYVIVEFILLSVFFFHINDNKLFKKIILALIIPFIIYALYDYYISVKTTFNFIIVVIECLILLIYIIHFFYEKLKNDTSLVPLYQTTYFWIVIAFFMYSSGNFFLFLYRNGSVINDAFQEQYTIIYSTFTITKNILICIGLSIKDKSERASNDPLSLDNKWDIPKFNNQKR